METDNMTQELLELKREYEQERLRLSNKKEALIQRKKEIYNQAIEIIKSKMDTSTNNERLQKYLEATPITEFEFLFRSLRYMPGNNQNSGLYFQELLLLDDDVKRIALEYGVASSSKLFKILSDYNFYHRSHPFLENSKVMETVERASKLAYLDEIFKNIDNILNYQGAYTVYAYVKEVLRKVLINEFPQTDRELIYKDYNQKLAFVLDHLSDVASYLLKIREQISNSRSALCNMGLSKMARKEAGTCITYNQKVFASGIAFGTTLEKLETENYEDIKRLIFIPHQKLLI